MTTEEIKQNVNMTDVLSQYGIEVRNGMCRCPFHGQDKHPSMKVYRDGVRCFTCGNSWDVFSFIQQMDHCDFKTAFYSLGGTYKHQTRVKSALAMARREAEKNRRERKKMLNKQLFQEVSKALIVCQMADKVYEPYSDEWCELKNKLPIIEFYYEERFIYGSENEEIEDEDVYRTCREINRRFLPNERDVRGITEPRIRDRTVDRVRKVTEEGKTTWVSCSIRPDISGGEEGAGKVSEETII